MSTILETLENLPVGSVVTDKRILSLFKRLGYIFDYSPWGYLESQNVYFNDIWDGKESREHDFTYAGPVIKDNDLGSCMNPFPNRESKIDSKYSTYINFEYKGYKFSSKYLSGCFNAYLELISKPASNIKEINQTISYFGNIM